MGKRVVERPWIVVSSDVVELPRSKNQYKYVVVFQDLFTRWIELKPMRSANGKTISKVLEELVLFRWECPSFLVRDNGTEYANKHMSSVAGEYGIKQLFTAPYHPQANLTEHSNRTIKTLLAMAVENDPRSWDEHLHEIRHAINTAV